MRRKTKKPETRTLDSFIARKDSGNAVKIASHCDIPGLLSFLVIEDKQPEAYRFFHTGANLYLDEKGFFFDYTEPYGTSQKKFLQRKPFSDMKIPLISRIADGQCVTESVESVSPFEIIEKLNSSDIFRFIELYTKLSNTHGVYSDRMTSEINAFCELAMLLETEDVESCYNPPYRMYNGLFVNPALNMEYPHSDLIWTITLKRNSGSTILLRKRLGVVSDLYG